MPEFFQFYNPTRVVYGAGLARDLSTECASLGVTKYFIVSDRTIQEAGLVEGVTEGLISGGIDICGAFFDVSQDSEVAIVTEVAERAKKSGAQGLIALGGGSVIDTAKGANVIFTEGGDLVKDYSGAGTLTRPLKPLIVIPTTAGTGSECTLVAVIYDRENKTKLSFSDKYLLPSIAVLDPEMTLTLPPGLTASTGMDALTHAIEASIDIDASPLSDILAFGAIELIFKNLVAVVRDGSNIETRGAMLIAANMAGIAFSHSMVGCVHAMAHTVGAHFRVPHGVANAILLPHGMEYNFEEGKEKFGKMASLMGIETAGLSIDDGARKAIDAVRSLTSHLNELGVLPIRLRDAGVTAESLPHIAEMTIEDGSSFYNPREMTAEDLLVHLKNAY
ncbi:MAG: iron-containing alcohol dehydrogenase [Deltaproteobacteria bacterium]|nr:iron-containing alcohol dehydrogenase [Deltaproteobacteria bacterium]